VLIVVAVAVIQVRDLFEAAMLFAIYSLLSAGLFVVLDAGDVALTEASVGAGISTIMLLAALALVRRHESRRRNLDPLALVVVGITGAALVYASLDLPRFADPNNPIHTHVAPYYIEQTYSDMGIPNLVAAVLASYRSIDTLGEAMVIFTAGITVFALLAEPFMRRRRGNSVTTEER
jgi:multicomponent Na+:H+ antiporter subunit B